MVSGQVSMLTKKRSWTPLSTSPSSGLEENSAKCENETNEKREQKKRESSKERVCACPSYASKE